jgi:hypothetical protein
VEDTRTLQRILLLGVLLRRSSKTLPLLRLHRFGILLELAEAVLKGVVRGTEVAGSTTQIRLVAKNVNATG